MRGFTLPEIIMSFLFVSMIFVMLVNLYPMSYITTRRGEYQMVADTLAQNVLEKSRGGPYEALVPGPEQTLEPIKRGEVVFTPTRQVAAVTGLDTDYCKEIVVKVTWEEKISGRREVVHRIVRSRVGP
ncbi:MAG: hypothetical protein FJX76_05480 [Armatimonadetes bacterium]|nr:hypothetical protein [Armatimonadota bacterium]